MDMPLICIIISILAIYGTAHVKVDTCMCVLVIILKLLDS